MNLKKVNTLKNYSKNMLLNKLKDRYRIKRYKNAYRYYNFINISDISKQVKIYKFQNLKSMLELYIEL